MHSLINKYADYCNSNETKARRTKPFDTTPWHKLATWHDLTWKLCCVCVQRFNILSPRLLFIAVIEREVCSVWLVALIMTEKIEPRICIKFRPRLSGTLVEAYAKYSKIYYLSWHNRDLVQLKPKCIVGQLKHSYTCVQFIYFFPYTF